jgi:hypothetical protein
MSATGSQILMILLFALRYVRWSFFIINIITPKLLYETDGFTLLSGAKIGYYQVSIISLAGEYEPTGSYESLKVTRLGPHGYISIDRNMPLHSYECSSMPVLFFEIWYCIWIPSCRM